MAQVTSVTPGRVQVSNASVAVPQSGNTTILDIPTDAVEQVGISVVVAGFALDTFLVQGQFHPDSAFVTLFSAAGDFTSPAGLVIDASGDLTIQAVGTGWLVLNTRPLYAVRVQCSSGNAAGSTVSAYATGK